MRFLDVLGRTERSELSHMEAAELLGVCERTFRRWRDRHREEAIAGLAGPPPATVTAACAGGGDRADAGSVSRALPRASRCSISTSSWASGTTTRWATR